MKKPSEHQEQVAYFQWVDIKALEDPRYQMIAAVPNAGKRSVIVGGMMKAEGLRKGFPDIICLFPVAPWHGLIIEMKVRPNKPTEDQIRWLNRLMKAGFLAGVCWGFEEAKNITEKYFAGRIMPRSIHANTTTEYGTVSDGCADSGSSAEGTRFQKRRRLRAGGRKSAAPAAKG